MWSPILRFLAALLALAGAALMSLLPRVFDAAGSEMSPLAQRALVVLSGLAVAALLVAGGVVLVVPDRRTSPGR